MKNKLLDIESLYQSCLSDHPNISTNSDLFCGVPHINGTTIEISEILNRLYVHTNIRELVKYYGDVTEEQVKDALAYAARFIELASNNRV